MLGKVVDAGSAVTRVKTGDYAVSARIVPGAAPLPDVEPARSYLLAAPGTAEATSDSWR